MERPKLGELVGRREPPINDPETAKRYPTLYEYLTVTKYNDGSPRVTATLLLFVDDGALKGCLNDRDNNRSAFISAPSLLSLLEQLDIGLREDALDWKRKGSYNPKGGDKIPW